MGNLAQSSAARAALSPGNVLSPPGFLLVLGAGGARPEPTPLVGLKIDAVGGLGLWESWEAGVSLLEMIASGSWLISADAWPGDTIPSRLRLSSSDPTAEPHLTS